MDILELMKERHSVRQYKNQAIELAKREEINAKRSLINTMREQELINKSEKEESSQPSPGGSQAKPAPKPVTFRSTIPNLLRNPTFMGTLISMTNLYFVVTGMQYWCTYYIVNVLRVPES